MFQSSTKVLIKPIDAVLNVGDSVEYINLRVILLFLRFKKLCKKYN